ncbi:MAG: hypothetical protein EBT68_00460 [Verrucomicrobia bacterium]|nr:hypothetical protein [Verrucomicrobiota bacterium]
MLEVVADLAVGTAEKITLTLRGIPIVYNIQKQELVCQNRTVPLAPLDGRIRLRAYVDRTLLTLFANDGEAFLPLAASPAKGSQGLILSAAAPGAEIRSLQVHELSSIWQSPKKENPTP